MPFGPKKPCRVPGCVNVTRSRFCEDHERQENKRRDFGRESSNARGYTYQWRKIRDYQLTAEPLCRHCKRKGRTTFANEVDHIKPLSDGGTNHFSNLQSLCKSCHSRKTALENRR